MVIVYKTDVYIFGSLDAIMQIKGTEKVCKEAERTFFI
jgi:hypothetical protein